MQDDINVTELPNKLVSKHQFYFENPLYEVIEIDELEKDIFDGDVDAYSAKNQFDTTYEIDSSRMASYQSDSFYNFYEITLTCKRRGKLDRLYFIVHIDNDSVIKIGQYPSLADLHNSKIDKKYGKSLTDIDLHEFKKAIGLAAHGVGAGSLIYLRRVFERLIFSIYDNNKEVLNLSTQEFKNKRMDEKVTLLKNMLPKELREMISIYSILSKGIHELSEDDCKKYFPALKLSIELILDEQIEVKKQEKKNNKIKLALLGIQKELNSSDEK